MILNSKISGRRQWNLKHMELGSNGCKGKDSTFNLGTVMHAYSRGEIKKLKSHLCVQGYLQERVFDMFAPVVSWTSVQIFLVLTMMTSWETCSIDLSNAFIHAKQA